MLWVSYGKISKEGIQGTIANPQNRAEPVAKLLEAYGGKLISYYLTGVSEINCNKVRQPASGAVSGLGLL